MRQVALAVCAVIVGMIETSLAADEPEVNPAVITVPAAAPNASIGPAAPYPSTIAIAGLQGSIVDVDVFIFGLSHTFSDDIDILLVGPNFGCGSSREQAAKALRQWGFRVVVAPGFGEIFFGNCFRNGILPVVLPQAVVDALAAASLERGEGAPVEVDLHRNVLVDARGGVHPFTSPPRLRRMLLQGQDEIDITLALQADIASYRARDRAARRWAYPSSRNNEKC